MRPCCAVSVKGFGFAFLVGKVYGVRSLKGGFDIVTMMASREVRRLKRDRMQNGIKKVLRHLSEHQLVVEGMDDQQGDCNVWEINDALDLKSHVQWQRCE